MDQKKIVTPEEAAAEKLGLGKATPEPTWEEKIRVEVMQFSQAIFSNWRHGIQEGCKHLPDELDPEQRSRLLDYFIDGFTGIYVNCLCTYGNPSKEFEDMIVECARQKFQIVRETIDKIKEEADKNKAAESEGKPDGAA